MNIEETKKAIEVMQAFVDGKVVEYRWAAHTTEPWETATSPSWSWGQVEYRIKPQPKEIWVNEYTTGEAYNYDSPSDAAKALDATEGRTVHYREVIEE